MRSRPRCQAALLAAVAALTTSTAAHASDTELPMLLVKPGEIKIDGVLKEWRGQSFVRLSQVQRGSSGRVSMRAALAYDRDNLYVAASVSDPSYVRTSAYREHEDHAALLLAFPDSRGRYGSVYEVKLFAGDPGKVGGKVKMGGAGFLNAAQIIEAPEGNGYAFEAKIPWSVFPPAARNRVMIRGQLRYYDGDGSSTSAILATDAKGPASSMQMLTTAPEQSLRRGLLQQKSVVGGPSVDVLANMTGDSMLERVQLYDRYIAVFGPRYRNGTEYYWNDLEVDPKAGELPLFEVRDLTGDGKAEIVLRKRIGRGGGWRELLQVLGFDRTDTLAPLFEHETGIGSSTGSIENEVKLVTTGGATSIQIALGTARGYDRGNYREPTESDRPSLLLPWGAVRSRTFTWDGSSFVKKSEEAKAADAPAVPSTPSGPPAPPAPRPPSPDELLEQVFALYLQDHKIRKGAAPSFDFVTNVAADEQNERIVCHGRDLVVFGKGFREGRGYVSLTMPQFSRGQDILDVNARDLTGDGHADILVRGVQRAPAPEPLGTGEIVREVFLVYTISEQAISRVFAAETAISLDARRIHSTVAFLPGASGVQIEIRPGRAVGWSRRTWPFQQDNQAVSGVEPLVLPWTSTPLRYRFAGSRYTSDP